MQNQTSKTHTLKCPITTVTGETLNEVPVKWLKRGDMAEAQRMVNANKSLDVETLLMAKMTGLKLEDIDNLGLYDYAELTYYFLGMVQRGELTQVRPSVVPDAEVSAV